jgi:hypothetical protein
MAAVDRPAGPKLDRRDQEGGLQKRVKQALVKVVRGSFS